MKMRKRLMLSVVLAALLIVGCVGLANAANSRDITVRLDGGCRVLVDGSQRTFFNASNGQEIFPLVYDGVTYLPLRAIGELMGKNVDWNEANLTVTLSGSRITAAVTGSRATDRSVRRVNAQLRPDFKIVVDGGTCSFVDANGKAVYPVLCNGSVYLPLRAIGELMGKNVGWDGTSKTVSLTGGTGGSLVTDADTFGGVSGGGQTGTGNQVQIIGVEAAKSAALNHAGVAQATFTKAKLDYEDGVQVYEIEFVTGDGREYEYEVLAADGSVLSWNVDYRIQQGGGERIGEEAARNIVLAKVPGAVAGDIVKLELDDGKYEIELVYGNVKHEFEIDSRTGTVLEWKSGTPTVGNTANTVVGGHHSSHNSHNSGHHGSYSYNAVCGYCGGNHAQEYCTNYYDCGYCGTRHAQGQCRYYN